VIGSLTVQKIKKNISTVASFTHNLFEVIKGQVEAINSQIQGSSSSLVIQKV
jgi:hypothetical protein